MAQACYCTNFSQMSRKMAATSAENGTGGQLQMTLNVCYSQAPRLPPCHHSVCVLFLACLHCVCVLFQCSHFHSMQYLVWWHSAEQLPCHSLLSSQFLHWPGHVQGHLQNPSCDSVLSQPPFWTWCQDQNTGLYGAHQLPVCLTTDACSSNSTVSGICCKPLLAVTQPDHARSLHCCRLLGALNAWKAAKWKKATLHIAAYGGCFIWFLQRAMQSKYWAVSL